MLFLGIDGGGSKTAALLVDESGRVVGWGLGGGSNYQTAGIDTMTANVAHAVMHALNDNQGGNLVKPDDPTVKLKRIMPDAVGYCLAGADMPYDFTQLHGRLKDFIPNVPYTLRNDVIGIFRAGSRFPYGVGMVFGTGFNAGGIDKDGNEFRFPALGSFTGDRDHLTYKAVGAAFRAWDGRGQATALGDAILKAFNAPNFETAAEWWLQEKLTNDDVRRLAPLVFEVCEAGDAVARRLIQDEGFELGNAANAVLRRLRLTDEDCDVVIGGSLAHGVGNVLMDTIDEVVHEAAPNAKVSRLNVPPVVGAVLLAADTVGFKTDANFSAAIRSTLPRELYVPSALTGE